MKIVLINGSPKAGVNASEVLLGGIVEGFSLEHEIVECKASKTNKAEFFEIIKDANALVFSFPLYVDGIPSHLFRLLCEVSEDIKKLSAPIKVYAISNNGFFEGEQNKLAFEIMQNYCLANGLIWEHGIGVGAGPMVHVAPLGKGPMKNIGLAIFNMAKNIEQSKSEQNVFVRPNFARFVYIKAAHMDWKKKAKQNGLKSEELYNRL